MRNDSIESSDHAWGISSTTCSEYSVSVTDVQRFSPYSTTYTVRGSSTFDIDFKAANVRGRVIDAETNDPIENASVQFRASSTGAPSDMRGLRTSMTDANGVFTVDFVNPGTYVITASREGFGNSVQETTFTDAGRDDLELRSITSYRKDSTHTPIDFDALPTIDVDVPAIYRNKQLSQEVQLVVDRGPLASILRGDWSFRAQNGRSIQWLPRSLMVPLPKSHHRYHFGPGK